MKVQRKTAQRGVAVAMLALVAAGCASRETSDNSASTHVSAEIDAPTTTPPSVESKVVKPSTTTPTVTSRSTQQVATTVPPASAPLVAPEAERYDFFGKFTLPLGKKRWVVDEKLSNQYRKVVVDSSRCGSMQYASVCPLFVVVDTSSTKEWMPYENPKGKIGQTSAEGKTCYWNMIQDGRYYTAPEKVTDFVQVGKWEARFTSQKRCNLPGEMFSLRSYSQNFMIYEQDALGDMMALVRAAK